MHLSSNRQYRPELDGIRALAIIAVIAYHAGVPYFSRGFVGVDFFFVISGYLITGILAQEALATGRLNLTAFYARRIRRLMPAALFMLTACVALYVWFIPPVVGNYLALARSIVANAFFASNFYFYKQGNGYFDESMTDFPLLHTWSLSVEEQYYLFWPLLIWALVKWPTRGSTPEDSLRFIRKLKYVLSVLLLSSFSFCVYYTMIDDKFSFYLLPARVWEFVSGGLLALYLLGLKPSSEVSRKKAWLGTGLATLGLGLCVLSIHFVDSNTLYYQGAWALWPVGGTTALIAGLTLNRSGFWSRFFSLRPLVWLGLLSYSWYLWHWPLLTINKIYALGGDTLAGRLLMCFIALVAAFVSYRWVEQPVRQRKPWLFATTKGTLVAGGGMILLMVVLAAFVLVSKITQQSNSVQVLLAAAQNDRATSELCTFKDTAFKEHAICHANTINSLKNRPVIVLWGDSHADHFVATLAAMYPEHEIHMIVLLGCPPLIGDNLGVYNYRKDCQTFNKTAIAHIRSLGARVERIYISVRWPVYFGQTPISLADLSGYPTVDVDSMYKTMKLGLQKTIAEVLEQPVQITLLGATPELVYPAPKCLLTKPSESCDISRSISDAYLNSSYEALQEITKINPSVKLIDLRPYFCNKVTCFASKDGRSLYTDDDHITATTARDLAGYLMR